MAKETLTRAQVVNGMAEVMAVLAREMTGFVANVYDSGFEAGSQGAGKPYEVAMTTLQSNLDNQTLNDSDFRHLVGSVISQLPTSEGLKASSKQKTLS